jgi:hypothetical protein
MPYPPGWERIASDRGTASAAYFDRRHRFPDYVEPHSAPEQRDDRELGSVPR